MKNKTVQNLNSFLDSRIFIAAPFPAETNVGMWGNIYWETKHGVRQFRVIFHNPNTFRKLRAKCPESVCQGHVPIRAGRDSKRYKCARKDIRTL